MSQGERRYCEPVTLVDPATERDRQDNAPTVDRTINQRTRVGTDSQLTRLQDLSGNHCVHHWFEAQVEQTPDAIAVMFEHQSLSYRQLNQRANQLAHHLRALGVGSDVLVGVYLERSLEMVVGLLGILKAGGAYVPLDPAYPGDRLAFVLEDTQISVVLTQAKFADRVSSHATNIICLDSDWEIIAQHCQDNPISDVVASNLMYVIYTSGSTGQPKGVMIPHFGICNQLHWRQTTFPLTATDRVLQSISFSFDPSVWQIFWTLCFGAQLVLPRSGGHQDSAYLVKFIAAQQITVIALVPSLLRVLLEEKGIEHCRCLKHVFCGGEALPLDVQKRFFERLNLDHVLHNVYGPTEASIDATFWTCQRGSHHLIAPIGRPITNAQVHILDANLQPVPLGESGELHIGGAGLARGYLNRPALTDAKFIPNPFDHELSGSVCVARSANRLYKTGDLARYLPDGTIEFLGRIDYQVKIRGFRIELEEIEATLSQHASVRQSVVVAHEDSPGNKRLVAYIVPSSAPTFTLNELRSFLKEKLPHYMVPSTFVQLEALPLNQNGKIDRHALPEPECRELENTFVAPEGTIETKLTKIWESVLNVHPIGATDHFVELGGDSLRATRIVQQIEQIFQKKLPLIAFFQSPTIQQLAALVQNNSVLTSSIVPIQPEGSKPPLFGIHVLGRGLSFYRPMAKHLGTDQPLYGLASQLTDDAEALTIDIKALAAHYIQNMRSLQPEEPYHLVGVSFGGIVAFEMAHQLAAQGQKVALLGMLDTLAPIVSAQKLPTHKRLFAYWNRLLELQPAIVCAKIRRHWVEQSLKYAAFEALYRWFYRMLDRPFPDALQDVIYIQENQKATSHYMPQPYSGRITLFKARDQEVSVAVVSDPRLGWRELSTQELEIHEVPGDHLGILQEPHVQVLAEKLKLYLN